MVLSAGARFVWLASDLTADAGGGAPFGSEVALENGLVVMGDLAICRCGNDPGFFCRWVALGLAPSFKLKSRQLCDKVLDDDPHRTPREAIPMLANRFGPIVHKNGNDDDEIDVRTNWIQYDEQGQRHKDWRQVVAESTEERFKDYPGSLSGPPQALRVSRLFLQIGVSPQVYFNELCRELHLS